MKRIAVTVLLLPLLLSGCAVAPAAPVIDAAAGQCKVDTNVSAPGDWLLGRWTHPYNTLVIRREGNAIIYQWERVAGLVSREWGEKAAATGRGHVTRVAGCAVEMTGFYVWSSTQAIVGREMIYKLTLSTPTLLRGQWYGAGRTWLEVSWRKEE